MVRLLPHSWDPQFDLPNALLRMHIYSASQPTSHQANLPQGRRACPYQQRSKYLSQHVCVQAVAGLCLGDLGEVCQEELQGETVMKRDGGGAFQDQAHLSVIASSDCAI